MTPIAIASALIEAPHLDIERTLDLLHALPGDVGDNARLRIEQAVRSVNGASRGGPYVALARYALAQVVVALEREGSRSRAYDLANAAVPPLD